MNLEELDPELAEVLQGFPALKIWEDIPAARVAVLKIVKELQAQLPDVPAVTTVDRFIAGPEGNPNLLVRIYSPANNRSSKLPGLLWLHGGGYILGSIEDDTYSIKRLVESVGCIVISVEYRLAPEHPFPAPIEDCYVALQWVFNNAEALSVDKSRIAIGGISAGGGLAAGLALLARDRADVNIILQSLICPMIDDRNVTPSSYKITDDRVWNREYNLKGWDAYLGEKGKRDKVSPYAVPARAQDLTNLPPAYISVGTHDLFIDENVEYAQRLIQAGVATELHVYPRAFHAFEFIIPSAKISQRALATHYGILKQALFG